MSCEDSLVLKKCIECNFYLGKDSFRKGRNQCKECCKFKTMCTHGKQTNLCKECKGASICKHNKIKNQCKECKGTSICEHNKIKSICKECKGTSICEHNRIKSVCKECGGGSICEHNKKRTECKECRGGSVCEHNKLKIQCKECGGSRICKHNKRKNICKECGGNSICEHNRIKYICKECKGSSICEHNRIKVQCKDCKGSRICEHSKRRTDCKECGGSQICKHNKRKSRCKECGGSQICEHKKEKNTCKDCKGSSICEHDKNKTSCIICTPKNSCIECKSIYSDKRTFCYPLCYSCFCNKFPDHERSTLYKIKERYLRDELRLLFPNNKIDMIFDKMVDGGCSRRKPDVLIELLTYSIIIECDENQHKNYTCENRRIMELFQDLGNRPIIFIRFNPDSYININNEKIEGCFKPLISIEDIHKKKFYDINKDEWNRRINILDKVIKENINLKHFPCKEITEIKLFYNEFN
jgi:hypothetical protein